MDPLAALSTRIESQFRLIAETRMAGIPVMNTALGVAMRGLGRVGDKHVGILVTPWFMNILFLPLRAPDPAPVIGAKAQMLLPSGSYEAIWNHEEVLGGYWSCSLFSPMFEFADMDSAVATADAAIEELMAKPEQAEREDVCEAMVMPAAPRDAATRMAEAEAAEQAKREAEEAAAREEEKKRRGVDRRALFGLRREVEGTA